MIQSDLRRFYTDGNRSKGGWGAGGGREVMEEEEEEGGGRWRDTGTVAVCVWAGLGWNKNKKLNVTVNPLAVCVQRCI